MIIEVFYLLFFVSAALSFAINLFLIWYCRRLLERVFYTSENMEALVEEVSLFRVHLNSIHELEIFYGDETLGNLLRHSSSLAETLEDFESIYTILDNESEEDDDATEAQLVDFGEGI